MQKNLRKNLKGNPNGKYMKIYRVKGFAFSKKRRNDEKINVGAANCRSDIYFPGIICFLYGFTFG